MTVEQKRILIIGSNSFSGAHLIDHALNSGFFVTAVSRSQELSSTFLPYKKQPPQILIERFQFHQLDINNDLDELIAVIVSFRPAYIVNFAAQGMVAESWLHPEQWFQTNLVAHVMLHEHIRNMSFLKRYVQVSTPEVYGSCSGEVDEATPYNPSTPYAVSKAACDMSLSAYYKQYDFPVVTTRAANVFGPSQQLYRIVPKTILAIKKGKKLPLHGGGYSKRSFIHISDVVEATLSIVQHGLSGHIYHLATDKLISIRELIHLICKEMNADFEELVSITDDRPGKDDAYILNCNKINNELNWRPRRQLIDGIRDTISWINENWEEISAIEPVYVHKI